MTIKTDQKPSYSLVPTKATADMVHAGIGHAHGISYASACGIIERAIAAAPEVFPTKRADLDEIVRLAQKRGASVLFLVEPDAPGIDSMLAAEHTRSLLAEVYELRRENNQLRAGVEGTVPAHKFNGLVQHCKMLEDRVASLSRELNQVRYYEAGNTWFWEREGENNLDSLTCPIVIQSQDLRELLATSVTPELEQAIGEMAKGPEMNRAPVEVVSRILEFTYCNYRGEWSRRKVVPRLMTFKSTEFHPEPQWLLQAFDVDRDGVRDFAMKDMYFDEDCEPAERGRLVRELDVALNGKAGAAKQASLCDIVAQVVKLIGMSGLPHLLADFPPANASDIQAAFSIKVEKFICQQIGRQWSAEGMSIESLIKDLVDAKWTPRLPSNVQIVKEYGGHPGINLIINGLQDFHPFHSANPQQARRAKFLAALAGIDING
jgi:hypothetical protein